VGPPAKLVVPKDFGHSLDKPKAVRAALEQNLGWFLGVRPRREAEAEEPAAGAADFP
jgi:hypothetical protein